MNEEEKTNSQDEPTRTQDGSLSPVNELYKDWFLDYASYVILERAVPALDDGLKPVQRRILHAMKMMDDGRFNKVANIIGSTMQYHPHGDASIGDAIVNLGQKDLLIDTQGNWGDIVTGDSAAASRYIEARPSKFALEVAFNPDTTQWQASYDGRKKEPVVLPMKFPLVLAQGAEGIAVGLSTKLLPHNFVEIIQAAISYLKGDNFSLYPDFPTNGMADFGNYNDGKKGGRVKIRSKIEIVDKKTLAIRSVPYGVTTGSLIESIIKANDNGKIKIRQVTDNTARDVEVIVEIPKGISPDVTIDALYAFTSCETSISVNACLILNEKPVFLSITDILKHTVDRTVSLLEKELLIKKDALLEKWHFASLEKIFIEKRIYRDIEECETWEAVLGAIDTGLKPYIKHLRREVTQDDIIRLTEIKIKRISKYDSFKADDIIQNIENDLEETQYNLDHLVQFAIRYFTELQKKFGKGRERKTEIKSFDTIEVKDVAVANKKLYVNTKEGFFGFGLKKDELVGECSELDDIITFRKDGTYSVQKVEEKVFAGKDIVHIDVFKKDDERLTYNLVYYDGKSKKAMVKRFNVNSVTREKVYDVTKGNPHSKILYLTSNPLGETEIVTVNLSASCKARKKVFEFDFATVAIKGRNAQGNILTKYPVRKITRKSVNTENIIGIDAWYDEHVGKLNTKETGQYLGNFTPDDRIIAFYNDGSYELTKFDLSNHYNFDKLIHIEQFNEERIITCVYYHGGYKQYFVKRFKVETTTTGREFLFISEDPGSTLTLVSTGDHTIIKFNFTDKKTGEKHTEHQELSELFDVTGWKTVGKKLSSGKITDIKVVDIVYDEEWEDEPDKEEATAHTEDGTNEKEKPEEIQEKKEAPVTDIQPAEIKEPEKKQEEGQPMNKPEKSVAEKKPKNPSDNSAEQLKLF